MKMPCFSPFGGAGRPADDATLLQIRSGAAGLLRRFHSGPIALRYLIGRPPFNSLLRLAHKLFSILRFDGGADLVATVDDALRLVGHSERT